MSTKYYKVCGALFDGSSWFIVVEDDIIVWSQYYDAIDDAWVHGIFDESHIDRVKCHKLVEF